MAGNPGATEAYDALLSTTLKNYTPRIEDNIFSNLPLLYWLKEAGHIEKVSGGEKIVEPLMYGVNTTTGPYSGYDNISTVPQEGITAAVFEWRQYAVSVAISGIEEAKNRGQEQVVSLLKAKIDQAEMSLQESMNQMFYGAASATGKDWNGLANFIAPSTSTTQTASTVSDTNANTAFGGIDDTSAANAWWKNKAFTFGSSAGVSTTTTLLQAMSKLYNDCSRGKTRPEFILTGQTPWEQYESVLQPQLRYQSTKTADAGFENLLYKSAPIVWDEDCVPGATGDKMYFLNSKFMKLKVHSDVWLKSTPFEKPHGQDARYSQILCYGNLVANNRRHFGVLSYPEKAKLPA